MPLIKGKSKESFSKNVETEMEAGKPQKQALAIAYAMKKRAKKMAKGGQAQPGLDETLNQEAQMETQMAEGGMAHEHMVDRIMAKRMSKGGEVANDTGTGQEADMLPNQFDDLVLRDGLESSETGANSGDMLGDMQEDNDRKDTVSRIMRSRAKRDRLPNPR